MDINKITIEGLNPLQPNLSVEVGVGISSTNEVCVYALRNSREIKVSNHLWRLHAVLHDAVGVPEQKLEDDTTTSSLTLVAGNRRSRINFYMQGSKPFKLDIEDMNVLYLEHDRPNSIWLLEQYQAVAHLPERFKKFSPRPIRKQVYSIPAANKNFPDGVFTCAPPCVNGHERHKYEVVIADRKKLLRLFHEAKQPVTADQQPVCLYPLREWITTDSPMHARNTGVWSYNHNQGVRLKEGSLAVVNLLDQLPDIAYVPVALGALPEQALERQALLRLIKFVPEDKNAELYNIFSMQPKRRLARAYQVEGLAVK